MPRTRWAEAIRTPGLMAEPLKNSATEAAKSLKLEQGDFDYIALRVLANDPEYMHLAAHFAKTPKEAFLWLKHAAELGSPVAMTRVGKAMCEGTGTPADVPSGLCWISHAVQHRAYYPHFLLSDLYGKGQFVDQDTTLAAAHLMAAKKCDLPPELDEYVEQKLSSLPSYDLAKAKELAFGSLDKLLPVAVN